MTALVLAVLSVAAAVMSHGGRDQFWARWGYGTLASTLLACSVVALFTS